MGMRFAPTQRTQQTQRTETAFRRIEISLEEARDRGAKFWFFNRMPQTIEQLERLKEIHCKRTGNKAAAHGLVAVWQTHPLKVAPAWRGELPEFEDKGVDEHWHNIYVEETVALTVETLRSQGIEVEYTRDDDPEARNGYLANYTGVISSCVRWRRSGNVPGIPARAMACLQLLSSAKNFEKICAGAKAKLKIIQSCACGAEQK